MTCDFCLHTNPSTALACEKCRNPLYKSRLRVRYENGTDEDFYLFSKSYKIGRGKDNDIVVSDDSVSRHHADLEYKNGRFFISDKHSKNGSLLNNLHFQQGQLYDLDCIQIGNVVIHYYDDAPHHFANRAGFDTIQFVRDEYTKLTQSRANQITTSDVLQTVLTLTTSLIDAECAVLLQTDKKHKLVYRQGVNFKDNQASIEFFLKTESAFLDSAIENTDLTIESSLSKKYKENASNGEIRNWQKMAIPLFSHKSLKAQNRTPRQDELLGICFFIHYRSKNTISRRKRELLLALMQQLTLALEDEAVSRDPVEVLKLRTEITLAKQAQTHISPDEPNIKNFSIYSFIKPCDAVSGDYFDFIPISDSRMGFAIGDICGKGIPAGLLASAAQAAIRSQLEACVSTEEIVQNLNNLFLKSTTGSVFLTLFFGVLDMESSELSYINAGHPPPIMITEDEILTELGGTTPPLGIVDEKFDTLCKIKFAPGDLLLMYTDGIIEIQNHQKQIYGRRRFVDSLETIVQEKGGGTISPEFVVKKIREQLEMFMSDSEQTDDLTLFAVQRKER